MLLQKPITTLLFCIKGPYSNFQYIYLKKASCIPKHIISFLKIDFLFSFFLFLFFKDLLGRRKISFLVSTLLFCWPQWLLSIPSPTSKLSVHFRVHCCSPPTPCKGRLWMVPSPVPRSQLGSPPSSLSPEPVLRFLFLIKFMVGLHL